MDTNANSGPNIYADLDAHACSHPYPNANVHADSHSYSNRHSDAYAIANAIPDTNAVLLQGQNDNPHGGG